ncbi:thiamine diphosphokinase [Spiroplasma diminutum]|uniref:Thiamine diphosphokinase n=1 Tax=Spiroplasma diminutum CUAS-1 TaxID=1276221 RepID=S5LX47_9MOLU|nr:thiamine diphosphokinase [Spiroplasma diminutum]AGR42389.1 thiamine pyrophosphokinase [Spiroplasma diminutum CUAS-1]
MKDKALIVVSKTNINLKTFENTHLMVGVERGCLDLIEKEIKIDLAISDFDQVISEELELIKENSKEFIHFNSEKDFLDGIATINHLNSLGYNDLTMIVKPSKRYDMNLTIIEYVFKYNLKIVNDDSIIFKLKKGENKLDFDKYQDFTYVSLFSLKDNQITIKDMKYEVNEVKLDAYNSFAYSNQFKPYINGIINLKEEAMIIITK